MVVLSSFPSYPSHSAATSTFICRMEQRGMHPRQVAHETVHAYSRPSFDNFQPPFYSGLPEPLGVPKHTQLLRPFPPPYVQQHYVLDRDHPIEAQRSPPLPHHSSDRPHGHPSLRHSPSPPQLQ